ncbi:hypothetical protein GH714_004884 [Hevea brasiliensis]|uniref:TF-B3 domain-containing protein n=1 Tax=Hevea brasiliensis TaxID=3981 RepID=A0A6A6KZ28_HEVBR|nr:hypothetical protein GH714_004884 [Hevea brasiliensis]
MNAVDTPLEACEDNHSIEDLSVRLGSIQQELQRLIKGKASVAANVMGPVNQNYSGNTTLHSITSFAVPTKVLKHLPIERGYYERDFTAFDGNGDQWNFVMAIRQTGDYQKPFLRPPKWHEFVVAHGLSGDDHGGEYGVIFYIKNDEPNRIQVRGLKRNDTLILGGQPIWELV